MNDDERELLFAREYEHLEKLSKSIEPPKKPHLGSVFHWLVWLTSIAAFIYGIGFYFHTTDFAILSLATILCVAAVVFFFIFFYAIFVKYVLDKRDYRLYQNNPRDYLMKKAFDFLMDEQVKEQLVYELSHGIGTQQERRFTFLYYGGAPNGRIKSGEL